VDARERLRRYLEQRRELGESELILDGMSIEDVLRVVGARPGMTAVRPAPAAAAAPPPPFGLVSDEFAAPADHPRLQGEGTPGVQDLPPSSPQYVPVHEERAGVPPVDAAPTGDWRAALRAADAAPARPAAGTPTGTPEDDVARRGTSGGRTDCDDDVPVARLSADAAGGAAGAGAHRGRGVPGHGHPHGTRGRRRRRELFGGPLASSAR
jgi:DNA polymerase